MHGDECIAGAGAGGSATAQTKSSMQRSCRSEVLSNPMRSLPCSISKSAPRLLILRVAAATFTLRFGASED